MAIWMVQFVGREIRVLDYIEGVGQPLGYYANELRRRNWKDAVICLPHDGVAAKSPAERRRRSFDFHGRDESHQGAPPGTG